MLMQWKSFFILEMFCSFLVTGHITLKAARSRSLSLADLVLLRRSGRDDQYLAYLLGLDYVSIGSAAI